MSRTPILPDDEEAERILLGPDSLAWRKLGDPRYFFGAGYALMLQVAHPTVGSGCPRPLQLPGGPLGAADADDRLPLPARLRRRGGAADGAAAARHAQVDQGREPRRHPLPRARARGLRLGPRDPDRGHASPPASASSGRRPRRERDRLYAEYMPLGRLVGVRPGDLPETRAEFHDYVETMIAERLVRHETVDAPALPARPPGAARAAGDRPALAAAAGRARRGR